MRKTILAIAFSLASAGAMATEVNVGGAVVSSSANVQVGGNGSAFASTGGYQSSTNGLNSDSGSFSYGGIKGGAASVEGVVGAKGGAYSISKTTGNGYANAGTAGFSGAYVKDRESYSEGRNFDGSAKLELGVFNHNVATSEAGPGNSLGWSANKSGAKLEGKAEAGGLHTPQFLWFPSTDTVYSNVTIDGESYSHGGGGGYGNATAFGSSGAVGFGSGKATAKSYNVNQGNNNGNNGNNGYGNGSDSNPPGFLFSNNPNQGQDD